MSPETTKPPLAVMAGGGRVSRAYGLVWLSLTRDYCSVVMARRVQTRSATSMGAAVAAIHRGLGLSADRADRPHPFGKVNGGTSDIC